MPNSIQNKPEKIRVIIFFLILITFLLSLGLFPRIAIPLSVAYVISLIFKPWIPLGMRLGLARTSAVYIVFTGILVLFSYPLVRITPVISNEAQNLQYYLPKVESFLKKEYSYVTKKIENNLAINIAKT